jgi:hypothetical protein
LFLVLREIVTENFTVGIMLKVYLKMNEILTMKNSNFGNLSLLYSVERKEEWKMSDFVHEPIISCSEFELLRIAR